MQNCEISSLMRTLFDILCNTQFYVILAIHIWNHTLHRLYPLSLIKNETVTLCFGDMIFSCLQAKNELKI